MAREADLDRVCEILDKLTLDALVLMEENVVMKLDIEKRMSEGESHLAKSRYIMGQNNVSKLQLPTSDGDVELNAIATVHSEEDPDSLSGSSMRDFVLEKQAEASSNPMRWFGVLVPRNLHYAQAKFREALLCGVNAVNLQTKLAEVCNTYSLLATLKKELKESSVE